MIQVCQSAAVLDLTFVMPSGENRKARIARSDNPVWHMIAMHLVDETWS